MRKPLISVIVPIYNAEKYLSQCIDSIISQKYENIELLLIDDGSNDDSGYICDHYAGIDKRIKVVHKKNQGVSAARNEGIDLSTGDYITFVDSDDTIEQLYLYDIISCISNQEELTHVVNAQRFNENNVYVPYTNYSSCQMPVDEFVKKNIEHYVSWGYLFVGTIVRGRGIRYNTNLKMSEDALFIMEYFQHIKTLVLHDSFYYNYRINTESVCFEQMTYTKALNHYNAALLINSLKTNNFLSKSAVDTATIFQFDNFLSDLTKMNCNKLERFDAQKKIRKIHDIGIQIEIPFILRIACCSVTVAILYIRILVYTKNLLKRFLNIATNR